MKLTQAAAIAIALCNLGAAAAAAAGGATSHDVTALSVGVDGSRQTTSMPSNETVPDKDLDDIRVSYTLASLPLYPETLFTGIVNALRLLAYSDWTAPALLKSFRPPTGYLFTSVEYHDAGSGRSRNSHIVTALERLLEMLIEAESPAWKTLSFEVWIGSQRLGNGRVLFDPDAEGPGIGNETMEGASAKAVPHGGDERIANATASPGSANRPDMSYTSSALPHAMPIDQLDVFKTLASALAQSAQRPYASRVLPTLFSTPGSQVVIRLHSGIEFASVLLNFGMIGGLWYAAEKMYKIHRWAPMKVGINRDGRREGIFEVVDLHEPTLDWVDAGKGTAGLEAA